MGGEAIDEGIDEDMDDDDDDARLVDEYEFSMAAVVVPRPESLEVVAGDLDLSNFSY